MREGVKHFSVCDQSSEIWRVMNSPTLLHGLDEVGQLLYEVDLLTASGGVAGGHKFGWKVFDLPSLHQL